MKKRSIDCLRVAIIATVLSASIALGQRGEAEFSVTIQGPKSVQVGKYIEIDIVVTNVTDHVIPFDDSDFSNHGEANFDVDVFDAQGNLAPRTALGRALRGEKPNPGDPHFEFTVGHEIGRNLKPGETVKESIAISKFFDMKAGTYTVSVSRQDFQMKPHTAADHEVHSPGDSDLHKPAPLSSQAAVNAVPQKPKAIAKSNAFTLTVVTQ